MFLLLNSCYTFFQVIATAVLRRISAFLKLLLLPIERTSDGYEGFSDSDDFEQHEDYGKGSELLDGRPDF